MKAAFYEKDITPPLGCFMNGYYADLRAEDVLEPLFVKAAVIQNDDTTVAIVGMDACEFPRDMHDIVCKRIEEYTGIPANNVLLSVDHSHRGMPIDSDPEINCFADEPYKDVVYRLIADCVTLAYKRLEECDIFYAEGICEGIAFNRNYIMKDGTYQTNAVTNPDRVKPLGTTDPSVPILYVKDKSGKPMGAVISFACHQDTCPPLAYSGQFAAILSKELKVKYGNDFKTVFVEGTCGDINHFDPDNFPPAPDRFIYMGKRLAEESIKAIGKAEPICTDIIKAEKRLVTFKKRNPDSDTVLKDVEDFAKEKNITAIRNLLFYDYCCKSESEKLYLQCIRIGDVYIYTYPGEIYVEFGLDLKKKSPSCRNIIATLANGGCGYVPTREVFAENSRLYEIKLCKGSYLDMESGYIMTDTLADMSKDLAK